MSSKKEERLFCICPAPVVHDLLTAGETKIAEQCGLCHKIYRQPCDKCASWVRNLIDHKKTDHKHPRKKPEGEKKNAHHSKLNR